MPLMYYFNKYVARIINIILRFHNVENIFVTAISHKGYSVRKNITYEELKERSFMVPINKCISWHGFGYGSNGWHPFVETLKDYNNKRIEDYKSSILKNFYDNFSVEKYYNIICNNKNLDTDIWPIIKYWYKPELIFKNRIRSTYIDFSEDKQQKQYQRTIDTFLSIEKYGYQPETFTNGSVRDGFVNVVLIKKNYSYRYIVINGQHRLSALSVLGYNYVSATFEPINQYVPIIIDLDNISNWPLIKNDYFSTNDVTRIFKSLFDGWGEEKAKRIGII